MTNLLLYNIKTTKIRFILRNTTKIKNKNTIFLTQSGSLILTIEELQALSVKVVVLTCVGEEALIDSSKELTIGEGFVMVVRVGR